MPESLEGLKQATIDSIDAPSAAYAAFPVSLATRVRKESGEEYFPAYRRGERF